MKSINSFKFIFIIIAFTLALQSIISINFIESTQAYSKIINYSGIIRGATQRLVKQELMDIQDNSTIEYLDSILQNLSTGEGEYNLILVKDDAYINKLKKVYELWIKLKNEIYNARNGKDKKDLLELSENYFVQCDEMVSLAEEYSVTQINKIKIKYIFHIIFISTLGLIFFIFSLKREKNLYRKNKELEMLYSSISGGAYYIKNDKNFTILYISDGVINLVGYSRKEIKEKFNNCFINLIYKEDRQKIFDILELQLKSRNSIEIEYRIVHKNNSLIWVLDKGKAVFEKDGTVFFNCSIVDITNIKSAQQKLIINEERYKIVMDQTQDIIFELSLKENKIYVSHNFEKKFGYEFPKENFINFVEKYEIIHKNDIFDFTNNINKFYSGNVKISQYNKEYRIKNNSGNYIWCEIKSTILFDEFNKPYRIIGVICDIDKQKKETLLLEDKAQKDQLTGLYNKVTTQELIKNFLQKDKTNNIHALLIVDIDNFKGINDSFGHFFGDEVLSDISSKIKENFNRNDIVGRIGGDEFIVFLKNLPSKKLMFEKASLICDIFRNSFTGNEKKYKISGSVGISVYPEHGKKFEELFKKADIALYFAKNQGKDRYKVYDKNIDINKVLINHKPRINNIESNLTVKSFSDYVFDILYENSDTKQAVDKILNFTGNRYNLNHIYIYQNTYDEEKNKYIKMFEWCLENRFSFENNIYFDNILNEKLIYDNTGILCCTDINTMPFEYKNLFTENNVYSVLQSIIIRNDKYIGCVGFCDHIKKHFWTQEEINSNMLISKVISLFF